MELYIVRHGVAEPRGRKEDAMRALTAHGRRATRQAARGLLAVGCRPDQVLTSPLRRAAETARILAEILCPEVEPQPRDSLGPGSDPAEVGRELGRGSTGAVMLVGHMPALAGLAGWFLRARGRVEMEFKKAGACCIGFDGAPGKGAGTLLWLLQPKHLRMLADAPADRHGDNDD